jgi:NADP-dependent 3-hydroxy acid dehydrogenase YdfG
MPYPDMNLEFIGISSSDNHSEEEIHQQINTNVYGPVRVIKAALPFMRAKKSGTIVNISSIAGLQALPSSSLYAASKFALEGTFRGRSEMIVRLTITRFFRGSLERSRPIQYPRSHR